MQVWNVLHGARWKCRTQKIAKNRQSGHHRTILSGYIFATKAYIDSRKKNLLSSNISSRCLHNMVNFGLLAAEIDPVVWGTPANFNGFRILAALLHGSQVVSPLMECRAVMLPRRETRWNLQGCPKLTKLSQPLMGRSSPYYGDMWRRYCCLTSFFPIVYTCLGCKDIARQSCAMVHRWRFLATFLGPAFSAIRMPHISDLHSKFALRPHHV